MTFIDPATGWFEIAEVPTYDLEEVKAGNKEYIDKTSARISLLFNNYWLSRYPRPVEVVYDNGSEFKKDFQPLIEDFDIKPKCTTVENPQANAPVERVHQVIHNMIRTKDLSNHVFDYIDPWGEILSSIAWAIRALYHSTLGATPAQLVFGRDMIFNIKTIEDWRTITARKQKQVIKDNLQENNGRIDHQYSVGDKVYLQPTGIQRKLEMQKNGPYCITHVFANGTVRLQIGATNDKVNIRRIEPAFE
jgi:Integrase core domain.